MQRIQCPAAGSRGPLIISVLSEKQVSGAVCGGGSQDQPSGGRGRRPRGGILARADAVAAVLGVETGFTWLLAGVLF